MTKPVSGPSEDSASAQSDQSLRCLHEETLGPFLPIERTAKTDQTGWMPRLIWVFGGCTVILFVLSWGGSIHLSILDALIKASNIVLMGIFYVCKCERVGVH